MHHKFTLENGLTIVTQPLEGYQSVSVGLWIKVGSSHETQKLNGISHFIEHMVFKGTKNRTAKAIALEIDSLGGEINAFTSKECTCYYTKTLGRDLIKGLDVLLDLVFNPLFLEEHMLIEKTVIEDEIDMYEDTPDELVSDMLQLVTFGGHPLSFPILGHKDNVQSFTREDILAFYQSHYVPGNMVLSIAGDIDDEMFYNILEKLSEQLASFSLESFSEINALKAPFFHSGYKARYKDIEQVQVSMDFPGVPFEHPLSYAMSVFSNILGGTNSSFLFQEIRENLGLTYSIYSEPCFYDSIGTLNISFGVSKENLNPTIEAILKSIHRIKVDGLTEKDLELAKQQLRGSLLLSLEGTESFMEWIGRMEMFAHTERTLEAIIEKIELLNLKDLTQIIDLTFNSGQCSLAVVGDVSENEVKNIYKKVRSTIDAS